MTLALRRTVFLDGERRPDDYINYGQRVGRIYRMTVPAGSYGDGRRTAGADRTGQTAAWPIPSTRPRRPVLASVGGDGKLGPSA